MAISFLTLPGELREQIYVEALTFDKETLRCTTQLLRTCKQIYDEASKYLYDNVVDVKVWPNGVYAHNNRCGIYSPQTCLRRFCNQSTCLSRDKLHERGAQVADFTMIVWPSFLRRIVSLRFTLGGDWKVHKRDYRLTSVENVWFSLCSFLHGKHKLQVVVVNLRRCKKEVNWDDSPPKSLAVDLWPARALGDFKKFTVRGVDQLPDLSRTVHHSLPDITSIEPWKLAIVRNNDTVYIERSISSSDNKIAFAKWRLARQIRDCRSHAAIRRHPHVSATCEGVTFIRQLDIFEAERPQSSDQRKDLARYCINIRRALELCPLKADDILMHVITMLLRAELEGHYIDEAYRKIARWHSTSKVEFKQIESKVRGRRIGWSCMS